MVPVDFDTNFFTDVLILKLSHFFIDRCKAMPFGHILDPDFLTQGQ